ncbi:MAG TPA: hypothetical protein VGL11_01195 [Candidatus Binatia bacterium]|jgi:hypothetical protein
MTAVPNLARRNWPLAAVFWGLLIAIACLSLDSDFNLEIPIAQSQSSHSFVGKITKDPRENQGGQRELAPVAALADWAPSLEPYFLTVVEQRGLPALHLLKSAIIRAPPSASV